MQSFKASKARGEEIQSLRQRIESLKTKAEQAERNYDLATAADLRHYSIPDSVERLEKLEALKREEDTSRGLVQDSVSVEQISEVVARWTGIPVTRLRSTERERLLKMESELKREVVGQNQAVKQVAQAIRLSRSGLSNADRPIASFLFAGSSGTGKTRQQYDFCDPR